MDEIIFKCEHSMFRMLIEGKPFDVRRWDLADDRCYRMSWGPRGNPDVHEISFADKETGEVAKFEYLGVEFTAWSPGWGFIRLGARV